MTLTKQLIGTKFLFDKNIIKYHDLIQLFENEEFNIKFATKPISNNLEVHSLYIKPDYEVTYLPMSEKADEYYKTAGYSCVEYYEVTLQEVLDVLGYKVPDKEEISEKQKKGKKSKFLTLTNENDEYTFRKKKIDMLIYKNYKLEIIYNNKCYYFEMNKERYKEVKRELKS
jgi:hypothetical protein